MSRKSLAVALLVVSLSSALTAPLHAANVRHREATPISRLLKTVGRWIAALSDGAEITIPKP